MFGNHGLGSLLEEGGHGKSPKCLGENLGDFGEFCKGLDLCTLRVSTIKARPNFKAFCKWLSKSDGLLSSNTDTQSILKPRRFVSSNIVGLFM